MYYLKIEHVEFLEPTGNYCIGIFEKIKPDLLHIQFDSHLYVHIPQKIHLYILQKKLKELIQKIDHEIKH